MTDRIEQMVADLERRAATENISFAVLLEDSAQALREMREALHKLERWSSCFIEETPISAETLWREFPKAIHGARQALQGVDHDR